MRVDAVAMSKPYSESCVQNRAPIFAVLQPRLGDCEHLLEIGSGTGQHAVYFAAELPHLTWHTSDCGENHPGITAWLRDAQLPNIQAPIALDVLQDPWPERPFDAVFSANTAHIMSTAAVEAMFSGVGRVLRPGARFLLYGPFNYDGHFTSPSNRDFDARLRAYDPAMGVRDVAWLAELATASAMALVEDIEMPVNNRLLIWQKA
mgnify:CR=1 FL=1|jgi:cyclopropane fatty-acyl-phospholipid synthase-like methyltransferase